MPDRAEIFDRTCGECCNVHPSEPFTSDFAICLEDPEFAPYIDDLFRTPSNNTTRTWYTDVFRYFEGRCPEAVAADALQSILDSPQFSYRIKKRVRSILDRR